MVVRMRTLLLAVGMLVVLTACEPESPAPTPTPIPTEAEPSPTPTDGLEVTGLEVTSCKGLEVPLDGEVNTYLDRAGGLLEFSYWKGGRNHDVTIRYRDDPACRRNPETRRLILHVGAGRGILGCLDLPTEPPAGMTRVELWFEDFTFEISGAQMWRALVVRRDIPATDPIAAAAVQAWIDGPTPAERKLGAHRTAPEGVELRGIDVEGSTAQVDMSEEIHYTQRGTCCEEVVLDTLIGTITQFEGIERMQLWTDGERARSFGGHGESLEPEGRENDLGPRYVRRIPVC